MNVCRSKYLFIGDLRLGFLKVLFTLSESGNESEKIISKIDQRINNIKEFSLSLGVNGP